MLGVRLTPTDEARLSRVAREIGRPKSALVREWIRDRLDREEVDRRIAEAAALDAKGQCNAPELRDREATIAWLRRLDAEDGGYDWGPDGPPSLS